jgi:hypothetical protein
MVPMNDEIPLTSLLEEIDKTFQEIGVLEIKVKENDVKKFYEITGNTIDYQEIVSPEYFMAEKHAKN